MKIEQPTTRDASRLVYAEEINYFDRPYDLTTAEAYLQKSFPGYKKKFVTVPPAVSDFSQANPPYQYSSEFIFMLATKS
ncbi:hypothetical protein A3J15_02790 [Candidatus Roizmanbacteria bacterium RIFCSPLOWO2_02_FULL_38_10]|uniref:Uncharacterized protein n=1 Tax=Candidatus Roizmanbacteria bacterium RIFCSPLOWO2_02_FULL_38_10 TaxID=1802074 RepID=A0A1F7JKK9_9BACT|nr:MAG: hypothetical protein A3J15_02790 [Candidatus Roizmanbacteria bacterium RIFCSPLOWO2_02_FULL_38_10]